MLHLNKHDIMIITYHYVLDRSQDRFPRLKGLSKDQFRNQIQILIDEGACFLNLDTLKQCIRNEIEVPRGATLLTFDDGYSGHFHNVLPILVDFGIVGTFFPVVRAARDQSLLDVNKIQLLLHELDAHELQRKVKSILSDRFNYSRSMINAVEKLYCVEGRYDTKFENFIKKLLQNGLPPKIRILILEQLFENYFGYQDQNYSCNFYMNIEQLRQLKAAGMDLGGHSISHPWLDSLAKKDQEAEISESVNFLIENGLSDKQLWSFCYPYGRYNHQTIEVLNSIGCSLAFTVEREMANTGSNFLELPRFDTNDVSIHFNR